MGATSGGSREGIRRERNCSVARVLDVVSDAWAFLIVREAFFETRTFEAFRRSLAVPRATLTDRLRKLTELGIFRRDIASPGSERQDYRLTRKGYELYPCFVTLMQFGDRWLHGGAPLPLTLVHRSSGCDSRPVVTCSHCGGVLDARCVSYRDGPGAGRTVPPPGRTTRKAAPGTFALGRPSSVARTLAVIGDKWSFMVLREAFFGVRRYDRMQAALGIAPNILTDRLSRLVEAGIFARQPYSMSPLRHDYRLTAMGRDLYGPFLGMLAWGDRWCAQDGRPLLLTHTSCGHDTDPVVTCDACRDPVEAGGMSYRLAYDPSRYGEALPR